jgi:RES domain-containing protein
MPVAWRIMRQRFAATPLDGEGAFRYGGRWNSRQVRMAYTSAHLSLAALELLVHLDGPPDLPHMAVRIAFDDGIVDRVPLEDLPAGWNELPVSLISRAIGDAWIRQGTSAVLQVPSVLIPIEANYLINPLHPDFAKVRVEGPVDFAFDRRLFFQK